MLIPEDRDDQRAALAIAAGVALLALLYVILLLGALHMKRLVLAAAIAAASAGMVGCNGLLAKSDILGVNAAATPEAQRIKAEADARMTDAIIRRLDHCQIVGNFSVTAKVSPDAGLALGSGLMCPPEPWGAGAVPLNQADSLLTN